MFGEHRVLIDHSGFDGAEEKDPVEWYPKMIDLDMVCVHGHCAFMTKWEKVAPNIIPVAWVRDPVHRTISQYYYESRLAGDPKPWPPDWDELIEYNERKCKNFQTKYFVPLDRNKDFEFIGMTEMYDLGVYVFRKRFAEGRIVTVRRENVNPFGNRYREILTPDIRKKIEDINSEDMELYRIVKDRWRVGYYGGL